ncbi:hypothetical protein FF2_008064 [Malus domestica]
MQKGGDTIDKYLMLLKALKDQLQVAGEKVTDNDLIIAALTGLPSDYDMIRTVILARDSPITLKEFRAQLIAAEKNIETRVHSLVQNMAAMYVDAPLLNGTYVPSSRMSSSSSSTSQPSSTGSAQFYNGGYLSSTNNFQSMNQFGGGSHGNRPFHFNNYRPRGNGGYKPRFNGPRNGNSWQSWSGNSSNRFEPIPECQICSRKGHVAVTCLYRTEGNNNQFFRNVKSVENVVTLLLIVDIEAIMRIRAINLLLPCLPIMHIKAFLLFLRLI